MSFYKWMLMTLLFGTLTACVHTKLVSVPPPPLPQPPASLMLPPEAPQKIQDLQTYLEQSSKPASGTTPN